MDTCLGAFNVRHDIGLTITLSSEKIYISLMVKFTMNKLNNPVSTDIRGHFARMTRRVSKYNPSFIPFSKILVKFEKINTEIILGWENRREEK